MNLNCDWCGEPMGAEVGEVHHTVKCGRMHQECSFRSVVGSAGHINQKCDCYGGSAGDPEGLTRREAARAAVEAWNKHHAVKTPPLK